MPAVFGKVGLPHWTDKPVAVVGNGLSLKGFDLSQLKPYYCCAVKAMIFDLPWASAGFGLDIPRYVEWERAGRFNSVRFPVYWAVADRHPVMDKEAPPCITFLRRLSGNVLSDDPGAVCNGASSGFGALNLAWLKKARMIVLFGYDYSEPGHHIGGHVNEHYYGQKRNQSPTRWKSWATHYNDIAPRLKQAGVRTVNASLASSITAFPRMTPNQALDMMKAA